MTNLYEIDPYKNLEEACDHGNSTFCKPCYEVYFKIEISDNNKISKQEHDIIMQAFKDALSDSHEQVILEACVSDIPLEFQEGKDNE